MRKRVCYFMDFFTCKLHNPYGNLSSLCILRDKVNALKFTKAIKKLKKSNMKCSSNISVNSLDYDGANDFSFLKRKYTRKYGLVAWSNYSAKFIVRLC